jgi:hypothetical protein
MVEWETYKSAKSIFLPHFLASVAYLLAYAVYPLGGRIGALAGFIIAAVTLVSQLLELSFANNPLRWIVPKGDSQNVHSILEPSGAHKQDLILIGHVDSQRTPLIFKNQSWLKAYQHFTTIAFAAFAALVIMYGAGFITQWEWIWPVSTISAICALILALLCLQADLTPFTHGANDNATAAGLVLTLAEEFKNNPLENTRLWFVNTGCEEVQHYGAIDFFDRHMAEFVYPKALVFEMLGCAGPGWLVKEGIIVPFRASPALIHVAESVNKENPELDGYPVTISGGNTEMADALRRGIPAITLFGMTRDLIAPYWHQKGDTVEKTDEKYLTRNYVFSQEFIKKLDSSV